MMLGRSADIVSATLRKFLTSGSGRAVLVEPRGIEPLTS